MHKKILFLILAILNSPFASAEDKQLKLLNPDGTPATDAQAIAIMVTGTRVDSNLKELPSLSQPMPEGGGTKPAKNTSGAIAFDSKALAVVAQNQSGFAFIPLPLKNPTVKLRPWAKLKLAPDDRFALRRESQQLTVLWENCFAGDPIRPSTQLALEDPFGTPDSTPKIDWRFDKVVMWSLATDASSTELIVNVPPGEVTVLLADKNSFTADWSKPFSNVRFTPIRTLSDKLATFKAPPFNTLHGKLTDADLPAWNEGEESGRFIYATPAGEGEMPAQFAMLFDGLDSGSGTILDELAKRYASEAGMRYRYGLMPTAHAKVNDDGTFRFSNLPGGKYHLNLFVTGNAGMPELRQRNKESDKPLVVELNGDGSSIDIGEVERVNPPVKLDGRPQMLPPADDPFGGPVSDAAMDDPFADVGPTKQPAIAPNSPNRIDVAEQKIKAILASVTGPIEYQGTPLRAVLEELQQRYRVPIRLSTQKLAVIGVDPDLPIYISLPPMTLQSALRHILSSDSDGLNFTIRDEMLLITTKEDAARDDTARAETEPRSATPAKLTEQDSGAEFIKQWLKTAKNTSDQTALRAALQAHLENEFDANQQARRAEFARLHELLKQSEAWLNTRQTRRAEIVNQKVTELLKQSTPAPDAQPNTQSIMPKK